VPAISVDELRQHLEERANRYQSLLVEYDVLSEAHVEPMKLMQWGLHGIRDYRERHRVGFREERRFAEVHRPAPQLPYAPANQVAVEPSAPDSVVQSVQGAQRRAIERKARGDFDFFVAMRQAETLRSLFDGNECFAWNEAAKKYVKTSPENFYGPIMYLANVGSRPIDPAAAPAASKSQQQYRMPDNLKLHVIHRILPETQPVGGVACIVLEGEREETWNDETHVILDRIWLAPTLNYFPRRWEQYVDQVLNGVRENEDFEEFAAGCWLPRQATWTRTCPEWTGPNYRGRPAYSYHMTLRRAAVNDDAAVPTFSLAGE